MESNKNKIEKKKKDLEEALAIGRKVYSLLRSVMMVTLLICSTTGLLLGYSLLSEKVVPEFRLKMIELGYTPEWLFGSDAQMVLIGSALVFFSAFVMSKSLSDCLIGAENNS